MLHTFKPEAFVQPHVLTGKWHCCNCSESFVFSDGYVFLAHYKSRDTNEIGLGLMCFCSLRCGLDFENKEYMGHA